jgi:hypothetical protein
VAVKWLRRARAYLLTATVGYSRQVKICPTGVNNRRQYTTAAVWAHIHLSALPDRGGQKVKRQFGVMQRVSQRVYILY